MSSLSDGKIWFGVMLAAAAASTSGQRRCRNNKNKTRNTSQGGIICLPRHESNVLMVGRRRGEIIFEILFTRDRGSRHRRGITIVLCKVPIYEWFSYVVVGSRQIGAHHVRNGGSTSVLAESPSNRCQLMTRLTAVRLTNFHWIHPSSVVRRAPVQITVAKSPLEFDAIVDCVTGPRWLCAKDIGRSATVSTSNAFALMIPTIKNHDPGSDSITVGY